MQMIASDICLTAQQKMDVMRISKWLNCSSFVSCGNLNKIGLCLCVYTSAHAPYISLCAQNPRHVCLLLLTRYIQGAASPKDMLILVDAWVTTPWFIHYSQTLFSFSRQKALMLTLWLASSRWALLRGAHVWRWQTESSQCAGRDHHHHGPVISF